MNTMSNEIENVIREVSPNDVFYKPERASAYFQVGKSAIRSIQIAMDIANKEKSDIKKILDLPSGHGRTLRYLKAYFPNSSLTACDIIRDAVDFCQKTFDAIPVYSEEDVNKITINEKFDLIWCGSLLTHLDKSYWKSFLDFFTSHLVPEGILVFTVGGRDVARRMIKQINTYGLDESQLSKVLNEYQSTGFGFVKYKKQKVCIGIGQLVATTGENSRRLHAPETHQRPDVPAPGRRQPVGLHRARAVDLHRSLAGRARFRHRVHPGRPGV